MNSSTPAPKNSLPAPNSEKTRSGPVRSASRARSSVAEKTNNNRSCRRSMRNAKRVTGSRNATRKPAARLRIRAARA